MLTVTTKKRLYIYLYTLIFLGAFSIINYFFLVMISQKTTVIQPTARIELTRKDIRGQFSV